MLLFSEEFNDCSDAIKEMDVLIAEEKDDNFLSNGSIESALTICLELGSSWNNLQIEMINTEHKSIVNEEAGVSKKGLIHFFSKAAMIIRKAWQYLSQWFVKALNFLKSGFKTSKTWLEENESKMADGCICKVWPNVANNKYEQKLKNIEKIVNGYANANPVSTTLSAFNAAFNRQEIFKDKFNSLGVAGGEVSDNYVKKATVVNILKNSNNYLTMMEKLLNVAAIKAKAALKESEAALKEIKSFGFLRKPIKKQVIEIYRRIIEAIQLVQGTLVKVIGRLNSQALASGKKLVERGNINRKKGIS